MLHEKKVSTFRCAYKKHMIIGLLIHSGPLLSDSVQDSW